jgi:tetratricopeptide (TPR) repeat protein
MAQSLPIEISEQETKLRNEAFALKKEMKYAEAESKYIAAWHSLPEPKHHWDSSQSILKSVVRFYFEQRRFPEAEQWAKEVFKCDPLPGDAAPYIVLGKIYLEAGREDLAGEQLVKAFELAGRRGFVGEEPKYLKFAQDQMKTKK